MSQYRQEIITRNKTYRSLRSQYNYLKNNGEQLYDEVFLRYFTQYGKKQLESQHLGREKIQQGVESRFLSLEEFWQSMGLYAMIDKIKTNVTRALGIGYKTTSRRFKHIAIDFNLQNPAVVNYITNRSKLHLSDRQGSVTRTTKHQVIQKLRDGVLQQQSYTQVAKEISKLSNTLFSMNRAELIATREIGKAYEYGNYVPMRQLHDQGHVVQKKRLSTRDDRVTDICRGRDTGERVPFNHTRGTDETAPRSDHPRCRCTTLRRIDN